MKFKLSQLNKQLRVVGGLLQPITQVKSPKTFKKVQWLYKKLYAKKRPKSSDIFYQEEWIKGNDDNMIRLCIYGPKNLTATKPVTGLLWLHGGGYANGLPEQETGTIEEFIHTSETIVIAPDYRLSIEAPFPAALEDAYASLLWMKNNAKTLGINENQLFIGGESAGGGLTCCLSAYAKDKGDVKIAYQIPFYPMLDDRMQTPSMKDNNGPLWNITSNKTAWKLYLGAAFKTDSVSIYAAPARLNTYEGLPPTYSFVGREEPFYDETKNYIEQLQKAGIKSQLDIYPGVFHAFDLVVPKAKISQKAHHNLMKNYKMATQTFYQSQN